MAGLSLGTRGNNGRSIGIHSRQGAQVGGTDFLLGIMKTPMSGTELPFLLGTSIRRDESGMMRSFGCQTDGFKYLAKSSSLPTIRRNFARLSLTQRKQHKVLGREQVPSLRTLNYSAL